MARTPIPITQVTQDGVAQPAQTNSDAANDHELAFNDGRVLLEVGSVDAGAQNVTVVTPGSQGGLAVADLVVSVPAGGVRLIGPFAPSVFNQADGKVHIDVGVGTLRFRAYRI